MDDFSRQVIKGETCTAKFVELDVEIPPGRGQITNIESLLSTTIGDLEIGQPTRRTLDETVYLKIEDLIQRGKQMLRGKAFPVTLSLDDPAGNSSIQPSPNNMDHRWSRSEYNRSPEQNAALSLRSDPGDDSATGAGGLDEGAVPELKKALDGVDGDIVPDEVYSFPATCPACTKACTTHMKMVDIPHFKEVIIMSTVCDHCGYRSNEVKTGGKVPLLGRRITLKVEEADDLARDILKSESCAFSCPELSLSVNPGTLGGRFTTVEGLLTQIRDDLRTQIFDTTKEISSDGHDSMAPENKTTWQSFFDGIGKAIRGESKFTVVLEDPLASSYVQNLCAPDPDPQLTVEDYERTELENEELGLNDMIVEGYEEEQEAAGGKEIEGNRPETGGGAVSPPPKEKEAS
ncbi:MAG: nucleolar zinc-finger protein [Thelocarpon impressellum]|nr:MAG: nucleolar zinc-finger protein [Thelocarpon impressellum]